MDRLSIGLWDATTLPGWPRDAGHVPFGVPAETSVSTDPVSSLRHRLSRLPGEASPSASDQTPPVEAVDSDVSAAGAGLTPACEGPGGVPVLHRRCVTCITCNVDALDKARVVTVEENRRRGAARQRSAVVTPQLAHANPTAAEAISITVAYRPFSRVRRQVAPAGGVDRLGLAGGTYSKHAVFHPPASYRPRPHPGPARGGQDAPGNRRQVDRLGSRPAP